MLVTTAMLQDIYSVKARAPFLRHYGEACAHLTDATFERGIVISTTPVPSLLICFRGSFILLSVPLETVAVLLS